jgi:23S rRNA pseudouridine1911/1915/1917 synthase
MRQSALDRHAAKHGRITQAAKQILVATKLCSALPWICGSFWRLEKLFYIVYEDADLLVVHKPADLVCHPTKGDEYSSLIGRARIYLKAESEPHLANRLDRETSGLVVIAKTVLAARELRKIWETRAIQKEYVAIVHGHVAAEQGMIDAPLGKDETSIIAIKDCVRPDGTPAQTEFFVGKRFFRNISNDKTELKISLRPFTLLRLLPRTGRKHQIRIHLQHLGHPIVGDKIYGGDPDLYLALVEGRLTEEQRARLIFSSHALHAGRLQFHWRERDWDFSTSPEPMFTDFLPVQQA